MEVETQDELVPILSLGRFVIRTSLLTSVFAGTCLRPFILKADYTTTRIQGVPFAWNSRNFVQTVANISMLFLDIILLPTFIDNRTYYVIDDYLWIYVKDLSMQRKNTFMRIQRTS